MNFLDVFFKLCQTPNTLEFCTVCIPRNQVQHGTERVYNINIESPKLSPDVPLFHVQFLFALRQHWTSHIFSIQGPLFSIYIYIYIYIHRNVYTHTHIFIYIFWEGYFTQCLRFSNQLLSIWGLNLQSNEQNSPNFKKKNHDLFLGDG